MALTELHRVEVEVELHVPTKRPVNKQRGNNNHVPTKRPVSKQRRNNNQSGQSRVRDSFRLRNETIASKLQTPSTPSISLWRLLTSVPAPTAILTEDSNIHVNDRVEDMLIKVTVYSLSGLVVKRKTLPSRRKRKPLKKPILDFEKFRLIVSPSSCDGIPIHSYLPSSELKQVLSPRHDGAVHLGAYWQQEETDEPSHGPPLSTLQMTKTMERIAYKKRLNVGQVSHFVPQHIDLQIGVSYGTDMISLGEASIAISGEEEEILHSIVPVRPFVAKGRKKNVDRSAVIPLVSQFESDPDLSFSLDPNAVLRIGVQVWPIDGLRSSSATLNHALPYQATRLEIADDDSLLSSLKQSSKSSGTKMLVWPRWLNTYSCSAFPVCHQQDEGQTPKSMFAAAEVAVTPLNLLSDVTESTVESLEDDDESNDT